MWIRTHGKADGSRWREKNIGLTGFVVEKVNAYDIVILRYRAAGCQLWAGSDGKGRGEEETE